MTAIRSVVTARTPKNGIITTMNIEGNEVKVYQMEDFMYSDIINYGYSAPLLLVFGNEAFTDATLEEYAVSTGLGQIAAENGGSIVFVNPKTSWDQEEEGLYENIISHTKISQWGFANGVLYDDKIPKNRFEEERMKRTNADRTPEYFIFGSPVACYVYAHGKGADYIGRYYLKDVKGKSSMGDLGFADITMTAATLENMSVIPKVTVSNLSIVSIGNSEEVNKALRQSDNRVYIEDKLDVTRQYDDYIGDYKRWAGQIRESFNCRKERVEMKPFRMMVNTSDDNHAPGITRPAHEAGALIFYSHDLDVTDRSHPVPLLLCFHGGGDTAAATAFIGDWPRIARDSGFMLMAVEMHMSVTANETMQMVEKLKETYAIDEHRLYATGFSMGGIKSWDFYQEYPERFAALAPMCATVDVGQNTQFGTAARVNDSVMVPVFYVGGERSPLAELPFQEGKCVNRIENLFAINKVVREYNCRYTEKDTWEDKVYGVCGDRTVEILDPDFPNSITTVRDFLSEDGNVYTELVSVSNQQHEIRPNTCRLAWKFMKQFRRNDQGKIEKTGL